MNPLIVKGVVFGLLLACAALWDMKEREIPNLIPAMILVCGLIELRPAAWLGVRKTVIAEKQLFYGICQTGLGEQKIPQREQSTPCGNFLLFYFLPFLCLELALPRCRCMGFFKCLDFFNTEIIVTSSSFVQES